jgi:hypothetical protein
MPYKDPETRREKQREYSRKWYQNNAIKKKAGSAKNRRGYRKDWLTFKSTLACVKCGAQHPAIIDFHHVIRDRTKQSVNKLASDGRYAAAREETKKCIPLCANCHRILHWTEAQEAKARRKAKRKKKKGF